MSIQKYTILHSNDMHGDIFSDDKKESGRLIGGLALMSGYINQVRNIEKNVFFVISGDMLQGSIVDTEYKGISTIEIMNYLAPDVVSLGNHEFDYGLPHLLFLEKVANFPIVSANLYIKKYNRRLMQPFKILKKAGLDFMFIGIITEKIMDALKVDPLIGGLISLKEASHEVGKICNAYKNQDIDLTILLTHIGIESDQELARMLKKEWGVDLIIGGHSHTVLEKPLDINNVMILQAGTGTDQIGRLDIEVDDATNSIKSFVWKLVPIDDKIAKPDQKLLDFIASFKTKVDQKYNTVVCRFKNELTHPQREIETSLGNLLADAFAKRAECDVMLLGSGSIRVKKIGPVMTLMDLLSCFPYDDALTKFTVTGSQLKQIFAHIMRLENRDGEGECYQVNSKVKAVYDNRSKTLNELKIDGSPILNTKLYTLCMQNYHFNNSKAYLDITNQELELNGNSIVVTTSAQDVLEEYLRNNQNLEAKVEGRMIYQN